MLEFKEESFVLVKEHLLHHVVAFNHFEQADDIQITAQFFDAFIKVEILSSRLDLLEAVSFATYKTSQVVAYSIKCVIGEAALIQDLVKDVIKLLALWSLRY